MTTINREHFFRAWGLVGPFFISRAGSLWCEVALNTEQRNRLQVEGIASW